MSAAARSASCSFRASSDRLRNLLTASANPLAGSVDVVLELPDRHALLELLDHVSRCIVRRAATRMRHGDRDARLTDRQFAQAMLDDDVRRAELHAGLANDVGH